MGPVAGLRFVLPGFDIRPETTQRIQFRDEKLAAHGDRVQVQAPNDLKTRIGNRNNQVVGRGGMKLGEHGLDSTPGQMFRGLTTN
jgi:hypothetical protein